MILPNPSAAKVILVVPVRLAPINMLALLPKAVAIVRFAAES